MYFIPVVVFGKLFDHLLSINIVLSQDFTVVHKDCFILTSVDYFLLDSFCNGADFLV